MSDFRRHWGLAPDVVFLNHGSFGACPTAVLAEQTRLRDRLEAEPVRFFVREYPDLLDAARDAVAAFLCADPAGLAFVPNATTGVNAVLRSFPLAPGDEILVTDQEYNACRNVAEFVAERAGAVVVVAPLPLPIATEDDAVDAVVSRITDRTRLFIIDHVTSQTGLRMPVERIVPAAQAKGVAVLVDGAHGPGMVDVDLGTLAPDFYTANCHKWICSPKGAGLLWVREDRRRLVRPAVISHGANAPPGERSRYHLEFDWVGTSDPTAVLAVPAALRFMGELLPGGWPALRARNRELALAGRRVLLTSLGASAPAPESMIGALAAVPLPDSPSAASVSAFDVDPLQVRLYDEFRIQVPIMPWPRPPRRYLRISAQLYNSVAEYERLASALAALGVGGP